MTSHADAALTFRPLCSQWRAQLWRRLWLPGPFASSGGDGIQTCRLYTLGNPSGRGPA